MLKTICGSVIDWSATGSMMAGIGTIAGAAAVIYAARKAADTFSSWRRQKHHERSMVVAEEILTLAYKLKRAFRDIRSVGLGPDEIRDGEAKLRETGDMNDDTLAAKSSILISAEATLSRTERHQPLFEALQDKEPVGKAVFGDQVAEWMNVFWLQRLIVMTGARIFAISSYDEEMPTPELQQQQQARNDAATAVIWESSVLDDHDPVANAIDAAIAGLEEVLLPIIRNEAE